LLVNRKIRKLGIFLRKSKSAQNIIIAKLDSAVSEGSIVYTSEMERLGIITEIFGPVTAPYGRIKLYKDTNIPKKGEILYYIEGERENVKWRKKKRKTRK